MGLANMNKAIKSCFTISLQCRTAKLTLSDHFRNNSGSLAMFAAIRRARRHTRMLVRNRLKHDSARRFA
jgi:hypothetical protein